MNGKRLAGYPLNGRCKFITPAQRADRELIDSVATFDQSSDSP